MHAGWIRGGAHRPRPRRLRSAQKWGFRLVGLLTSLNAGRISPGYQGAAKASGAGRSCAVRTPGTFSGPSPRAQLALASGWDRVSWVGLEIRLKKVKEFIK